MKFKEFLYDKKFLILFFFFLMLFISLVVFFDGKVKIGFDNIVYINIVCLVMFFFYLTFDYFYEKRYFDQLSLIIADHTTDTFSNLPTPVNFAQNKYNMLINRFQTSNNQRTTKYYNEKKDFEDFINSWVHCIKTPISVCKLVIESNRDKSTEALASSLEDEIFSIENYVEQALYFSRIDSFSRDYIINEIAIEGLIKELIKKHAKTFISKKIKLELSDLNFCINSDKKWLFFIINEIVDNSLKYSEPNSSIKIYGCDTQKGKQLVIEDNGIGIKEEDLPRVFDKSFTGYNGRENNHSTGFGLYLAKTLAKKLNHDIIIASTYHKNTIVRILFPDLLDFHDTIS